MKAFFVLHHFDAANLGGTERVVLALAHECARRGHEVVVVSGSLERASCDRVDDERVAGLRVLRLHRDDVYFESWWKAWSPRLSTTFARLLVQEKPDVVHVHHWLRTTTDLARLARAAGAIVTVTLHDHFAVLARSVRMWGESSATPPPASEVLSGDEVAAAFAFHRADLADEIAAAHRVYAPSAAHVASLRAMAGEELATITPLAPPHDLAAFPRGGGTRAARTLLSFGALYEAKGVHVLLEAMRLAATRGHTWELELLGSAFDPGYEARIASLCEGLPVRRKPRFAPSDLGALRATCAVFPALSHESYGLVLEEARALGLPMLLSDLPAFREHAEPASSAFFAPGSVAELAAWLCRPEALHALAVPPPPGPGGAAAAVDRLLADVEAVRTEPEVALRSPRVDAARRMERLFARAEHFFGAALERC